jgi:hypothetical protein
MFWILVILGGVFAAWLEGRQWRRNERNGKEFAKKSFFKGLPRFDD